MRKRILVVDDNAELLKLLRLHLRAAGYSVTVASDGIQALRKAKTSLPDLVVLDLVLPELDGFAVCEELRRSAETSRIPVILLTGLSGEFARLAGLESGATDFLKKPTFPRELIARIERLLNGPERAAEQQAPPPADYRSVVAARAD